MFQIGLDAMTISADLARLADTLKVAEQMRVPVEPITETVPDIDLTEAYAIQLHNIRRRVQSGGVVKGFKVGLTAKSMQEMFGISQPDYGHLMADMFYMEDQEVALERFIQPMVEVEPAFILGRDLHGPDVTVAEAMQAVNYVVTSVEIIDSRIRNWAIRFADTVADNGSSGGVVLAGRPVRLESLDLRELDALVELDGSVRERGSSKTILGNPLNALAWLANALARFDIGFPAGSVVLPGTCCRAVPVKDSCSVQVSISGLGPLRFHFV